MQEIFKEIYSWIMESLVASVPFASLTAIILLLFRSTIEQYLTKGITSKFDRSLAELNSKLMGQERRSGDLRDFIFSGISARRNTLREKEIDAAERIWKATQTFAATRVVQKFHDTIDFEVAAESSATNKQVTELFSSLGKSLNKDQFIERLAVIDPIAIRPFVPEMLWALYAAYSGILMNYVVKQIVLETGAPPAILSNDEHLKDLVLAALPNQQVIFDKYVKVTFSIFLEILEDRILAEVKRALNGDEESDESIQSAARLLEVMEHRNRDSDT